MRVDLRSCGPKHELYVNGVLVLASEDMGAREALEAIGDVCRDVEFLAIEVGAGDTMKLFDKRFLMKGSGGSVGGKECSA